MPKWLHDKLAATARRKGYKGERFKQYVYGNLQNYEKGIRGHLSKKKKKKKKSNVAKPGRRS